MRRISEFIESCHTYEGWMSHVTRINEHTPLILLSHVTDVNKQKASHVASGAVTKIHQQTTPQILLSHVTHDNDHVTPPTTIMSHITMIMSHITMIMSHITMIMSLITTSKEQGRMETWLARLPLPPLT